MLPPRSEPLAGSPTEDRRSGRAAGVGGGGATPGLVRFTSKIGVLSRRASAGTGGGAFGGDPDRVLSLTARGSVSVLARGAHNPAMMGRAGP